MSHRLLHRLFGFICGSVGLVVAITGAMFWFDPPKAALPAWCLLGLMVAGAITLIAGVGVAAQSATARIVMIVMAVIGLATAVAGVARAALHHNLGAVIIVLTAVMPLVLVIAVMYELGRDTAARP